MIDLLKLHVPFLDECLLNSEQSGRQFLELEQCGLNGMKIESKNVVFSVDGDQEIHDLRHPFEALPSSFGSLAVKIYQGNDKVPPHVILKASPAKLLQFHNVYGPTDISLCAMELIQVLLNARPEFCSMLDFESVQVDWIDCTYHAKVSNDEIAKQVITHLKNISHGHMRRSNSGDHETTVNFNKAVKGNQVGRHKQLKVYLKFFEVMNQIDELQKKAKRDIPNDQRAKLGMEPSKDLAMQAPRYAVDRRNSVSNIVARPS
ncbi:phage/plasmid replication protein, II/X family [Dongshaea marina]|uniref:phage/plasmid replication protein, II/X family n=1 Tax=Dongshaea marina TaxID=2047966 RepID=UPI000D3ECF01|nr:phage/plasmid replication protein, II/X family [Dongshaea marina]